MSGKVEKPPVKAPKAKLRELMRSASLNRATVHMPGKGDVEIELPKARR